MYKFTFERMISVLIGTLKQIKSHKIYKIQTHAFI